MKTIGILGGLGPESTMEYYKYITREYHDRYRDYRYPNIILHSISFEQFIEAGYELPGLVKREIVHMYEAGADFIVAACNSVHIVYDTIAQDLPIPWISIMDTTAEEIKAMGLSRVALLGTIFTMSKGFYHNALAKHDIDVIVPAHPIQEAINGIIFDELITAHINEKSRTFIIKCIKRLKKNGAEGVVLGCTELPFLIKQEHIDIPVLDTASIHAETALQLAVSN